MSDTCSFSSNIIITYYARYLTVSWSKEENKLLEEARLKIGDQWSVVQMGVRSCDAKFELQHCETLYPNPTNEIRDFGVFYGGVLPYSYRLVLMDS